MRQGLTDASYYCASCGERVETTIDASQGARQRYTEDCSVCCRPNVLSIRWDEFEESFAINAELEYE